MAWIKWVIGLEHRPEVLSIADQTGKEPELIAALCMLAWAWADTEGREGFVVGATPKMLDLVVKIAPGFADAMIQVGWANTKDDGLQFTHWDVHNSQSAKDRALDQKRKSDSRWTETGHEPDTNRTKPVPEERRGEESKTHTPAVDECAVAIDGKAACRKALCAIWKIVDNPDTASRLDRLAGIYDRLGATPDEMERRRKRMAGEYSTPSKATPEAVAKRWGEYGDDSPYKPKRKAANG